MDMQSHPVKTAPAWLRWCAVLTVVATVPLLTLGAFVTTMGVGMADQRGLVNPLQAIYEFMTGEQGAGWKVEHTHRLAGWLVGIGGIVLAAGAWWADPRPKAKWLATLALVLICVQGFLGIYRVRLNAWWGTELAWIHGCFAQIVFAVLVCTAWFFFQDGQGSQKTATGNMRGWSWLCLVLVFSQLILGGMVRHMNNMVTVRLHLLNAFAVSAAVLWLMKLALNETEDFRGSIYLLIGLVTLQILLGVEALFPWMRRLLDPSLAIRESMAILWVRSLHYLLGTLIFADLVVIALKAHRGLTLSVPAATLPAGVREGTA